MIKGYLLDTNICVYAMNAQHKDPLRRTTQEAAVWLRFVDEPAPLYTSEVSLGELVFGAERSKSRDKNLARVEAFLKLVPPLAIARDTWQMFGTTKAALTMRGMTVPDLDLVIACLARCNDLVLVTNDPALEGLPAEFERENWT